MASSLAYKVHHYAPDKDLQQVGVWPLDLDDKSKYWVIYIHGGAWRDPAILHKTFVPSIDKLLSSSTSPARGRIAAFASIDYRLSAHPDHPQDPNTTPASQIRDALHPDHANDVVAAISYLQAQYGFGSRYILLGHSAGATLTFQAIADLTTTTTTTKKFVQPEAAIGLCGIYDLSALWDRTGGTYGFIRAVFGPDRIAWDAASPARFPQHNNNKPGARYSDIWHLPGDNKTDSTTGEDSNRETAKTTKKPVVILASSPEDELISEEEVQTMAAAVEGDTGLDYTLVKDMRGKHDDIWLQGDEVARLVALALDRLA
ncbi:Alpha/Beta hydrolase protein [Microdochium trichocladiopsis]|uniref:Kynurenine formamidase n=1 Tax=Microdochium trichocladiopsis TaxID=1682393 RepID=A0A9P8Y8T4_9PEZI|nr:Alpha/Beta hydrolase protein [Microdochium trichocladiopsis]KAH7033212.1 Alpha/Beta hydrolase protein [Microdochium trichocladiopsis]